MSWFKSINPRDLLVAFILLAACLLTYSNSLHNDFIIDDNIRIINNKSIHDIKSLYLNFIPAYMKEQHGNYYRPILHGFITVNYLLFGTNPFGYHAVNLTFFFIAAILFYGLLNLLFGDPRLSFLSALLFATHPINGVLVNYKTATAYSVLIIFTLLSIFAFLKYYQSAQKHKVYLGLSLACFLASLLCHEQNITFPFYLAALLYFVKGRGFKEITKCCTPYMLLLFSYFLFRFKFANFNQHIFDKIPDFEMSFSSYLATLTKLILWYFSKMVFLKDIVLSWAAPIVRVGQLWWNLIFLIIFMGSIYLLKVVWKGSIKAFALSWIMIGFIPVTLGCLIEPEYGLTLEPHWLLFSTIGYFILLASLISDLGKKINKYILGVLIVFLLAANIISSRYHNFLWANEKRYCQYWLKHFPDNSSTLLILASDYMREGKFKEAKKLFNTVISRKKSSWLAYLNLGIMSYNDGDFASAIEYYRNALRRNPKAAIVYNNLGIIFIKNNDLEKANKLLMKAISVDPFILEPRLNLAKIYQEKGEWGKIESMVKENLAIDPNDERSLFALAQVYWTVGKREEMIEASKRLLKVGTNARKLTTIAEYLTEIQEYDLARRFNDRAKSLDQQLDGKTQ